jgi:prevent-host-death family protein
VTEVGISKARMRLSQLVRRAESGEEIVITRYGEAVARLVPLAGTSSFAALRGAWRGRVHIANDFDELQHDIAEAFGAHEPCSEVPARQR